MEHNELKHPGMGLILTKYIEAKARNKTESDIEKIDAKSEKIRNMTN